MKIIKETRLKDFEAWSGAVSTLERIKREDKCEALETILKGFYPNGILATKLNDLLWFDSDLVYDWVGLRTESELEEELEELKDEFDELEEELKDCENAEEEIDLIKDIKELKEKIKEVKKKLKEF